MKKSLIGVSVSLAILLAGGIAPAVSAQEAGTGTEAEVQVSADADLAELQSVIDALHEQVRVLTDRVADMVRRRVNLRSEVDDQEDDVGSSAVHSNAPQISQRLQVGARGQEVRELQQALATDPSIYPEGLVTGYFGPLTHGALQRFQAKAGLSETGEADENTLSRINKLLEHGAGNSGVIPPGLLLAPGIQARLSGVEVDGEKSEAESENNSERSSVTDTDTAVDMEFRGVIVEIDASEMAVDGPTRITIQLEGRDATYEVRVPSGEARCEARANIADMSELEVGITIEVKGKSAVTAGPVVTPCASDAHYLRIVE